MRNQDWSLLACCFLSHCCFSVGFIDFIVEPTFTVLTDMTEKIVSPLIDESSQTGGTGQRRSRSVGKFESWVVIASSCWGMCGITMSCTSLASYRRHVCPLLSFRGFRMIPSILARLAHNRWPKARVGCPTLWSLCFQKHWSVHFYGAQKTLVPDSADGQAFDQSSYRKWGWLSFLFRKKEEYRFWKQYSKTPQT